MKKFRTKLQQKKFIKKYFSKIFTWNFKNLNKKFKYQKKKELKT